MDAYSPETAPWAALESLARRVTRAVEAFRRGEPVAIVDERGRSHRVISVETTDPDAFVRLIRSDFTVGASTAITARRALRLGLTPPEGARALLLGRSGGFSIEAAAALADPLSEREPDLAGATIVETASGGIAEAAVDLARSARLLPAALVAGDVDPGEAPTIGVDELARHRAGARRLTRVVEAAVPLEASEEARLILFRPGDGGPEHTAVIVGRPDPGVPPLVRLHSECFTGDLLGSLRCDCGEQLRGAIRAMANAGAGVLLHLAQEGRGIGLVNKLRAYRLQDQGRDTVDANEDLGFDPDERVYAPAAEMLRHLGLTRIRLMTNNPDKPAELARAGIEVVERVPHRVAPNRHSAAYLATKAARSGHLMF